MILCWINPIININHDCLLLVSTKNNNEQPNKYNTSTHYLHCPTKALFLLQDGRQKHSIATLSRVTIATRGKSSRKSRESCIMRPQTRRWEPVYIILVNVPWASTVKKNSTTLLLTFDTPTTVRVKVWKSKTRVLSYELRCTSY